MTRIAGVHGIGNYHYVADAGSPAAAAGEISADWTHALTGGLASTYPAYQGHPDLRVAYYAHLLHRGTAQGDIDPAYLDADAQDLLVAWVEQLVSAPVPQIAQGPRTARARAAADWLTRHFGERTRRGVISFCREVSTYLGKESRRQAARDTARRLGFGTRIWM